MRGQKEPQRIEAERIDELASLGLFPRRGSAIDGGAHVGSMTLKLAQYFKSVWAFEPCAESYLMLCENCVDIGHILPLPMALMDRECRVDVRPPRGRTTLTARQVDKQPLGNVRAVAIDDMHLFECDFIKLDLEGCEYLALKGAIKTIQRFRPTLMIEFNESELGKRLGYTNSDVLNLLDSLGYTEVWRSGVDKVFTYE